MLGSKIKILNVTLPGTHISPTIAGTFEDDDCLADPVWWDVFVAFPGSFLNVSLTDRSWFLMNPPWLRLSFFVVQVRRFSNIYQATKAIIIAKMDGGPLAV